MAVVLTGAVAYIDSSAGVTKLRMTVLPSNYRHNPARLFWAVSTEKNHRGSSPQNPTSYPSGTGAEARGQNLSKLFSHAPLETGMAEPTRSGLPLKKWSRTPWHKAHGADTPKSPPFLVPARQEHRDKRGLKNGRSHDLKPLSCRNQGWD